MSFNSPTSTAMGMFSAIPPASAEGDLKDLKANLFVDDDGLDGGDDDNSVEGEVHDLIITRAHAVVRDSLLRWQR